MIKDVIKRFKEIVNLYPDKRFLINADKTFTYREIDDISDKVCHYLNMHSIGIEDVVAVYIERSYLSLISVLGILKAKAAFLPIDSKTPIQRVNSMIELSRAKCILTENVNAIDCSNKTITVNIHDILSLSDNPIDILEHEEIQDSTLAYILFTSGSTGLPKGAMVEHGGMNNHLMEKIRLLNLNNESVIAHNASISFDVSVWQMLAPICIGATLVIFPENDLINLRNFISALKKNQVDILEVVPTYLNVMLHELKKRPADLRCIKYVISTGEVLTKSLADRCFEIFPNSFLVNAYGPTEASDDITHCIFDKNHNYNEIPIGKPINNANINLVKSDGSICGVNEAGELLVSGICVGRGYVSNESETKLSFLVDPNTGIRTYRTGDLVSMQIDGNYIFHERIDMQISIHGKRVELKEIERILLKYPRINDCAVIYLPQREQLAAYYVCDDNNKLDIVEIKNHLKIYLPMHMIPTYINCIDKLPTNISGKVDSIALQELFKSSSVNNSNDNLLCVNDNESSSVEDVLLKALQEIIENIQLSDNDEWKNDMQLIGMNSISAIKLIVKIEEIFDFEFEDEYLLPKYLYNFKKLVSCIEKHKG